MARLPIPGSDNGVWGSVLNDFLGVAHNSDGTLKDNGVLAQKVPTSRLVSSGIGLSGGGDLSADRTLAVVNDSTTQKVRVSQAGTLTGTRQEVNLIEGSNVTLTTADDAGNNRVNVTIAAASGGTPAGSVTSETAFGQSTAVGSSTDYARADHSHGTPNLATFSTPLVSDLASTSTSLADTTGISLSVDVGTYEFEFIMPYMGSVSTGSGIVLQLNGPSSSFLLYNIIIQSSVTTTSNYYRDAFASSQSGVVVTTAGSIYFSRIVGRVTTTASGTLQPQFACTNSSTTTTIKAGSYARLQTF